MMMAHNVMVVVMAMVIAQTLDSSGTVFPSSPGEQYVKATYRNYLSRSLLALHFTSISVCDEVEPLLLQLHPNDTFSLQVGMDGAELAPDGAVM